MSCILVTRMYRLNAGVALELPCGAIPSYVLHPPTFQPRTQRLPLASQEKGRVKWDLIRSPAPSQDPQHPPKENLERSYREDPVATIDSCRFSCSTGLIWLGDGTDRN